MNVLGQPNFPKSVWADSVESFGQVNKGRVEVSVLFHTFFLKLTSNIMSVVPRPAREPH